MDFYRITIAFSTYLYLQLVVVSADGAEKKRVVIVGAGASGIAAATRLFENGIEDIAVLEAEPRIGGRIHSVNVTNGSIEMGAQWIHGQRGNVVYDLASSRNLTYQSYDPTRHLTQRNLVTFFARSTGEFIEPKLAEEMKEIRKRVFDNPGYNATSFKNSGEFYVHLLETELNRSENANIPNDVKSEFVEFCHQSKNVDVASETWFNLSVSTFQEYQLCPCRQDIRWRDVGYQTLFNILMEKSQESSNGTFESLVVALNTTVEHISLANDDQNINRVVVECSNGRRIHADHVIVTASLGVLKVSHAKIFENGILDNLKLRTIENLEFGTVGKIFIEFSEKWWPDDAMGFHLLWTRDVRKKYVEMGHEWVTGMYAVAVVDFAENFLCGWISGTDARTVENLDEEVVRDTVIQVLRKFLHEKWNVSDPVRIVKSNWYSNEHFKGSYSYRSPRTDAANVSASSLSLPVINSQHTPVILFAGEATNPRHYSTVHGAVESGWREAERLIPYLKH